MKQITNRQMQAIQTKNKLLNISIDLIKKNGFDSVSIQQICEEAGVSTGAFYHHLKSKAGIVIETYKQFDLYFEQVVINKVIGETYIEKILDYIGYEMKYAVDGGVDLIIQIYKAQITEGTDFFLSPHRGLANGLCFLIKQGQDLDEISKDTSSLDIADEILIISRGVLYNWCQHKGSYSLEVFARKIVGNYLSHYRI